MYEVVGWAVDELPEERPRHLLGIGDVDDLLRGVELGSTPSTARCRPASAATAWP
jgi:tRNA-guanine family transglycosylase